MCHHGFDRLTSCWPNASSVHAKESLEKHFCALACHEHAPVQPDRREQSAHASGVSADGLRRDLKALIKLLTLLTQRDVLDFGGESADANPDIAQVPH